MLMFKRTFWRNHVEDQDGKVIQQGTLLEQDQFNRMEVGISDSNMAANIIHIMLLWFGRRLGVLETSSNSHDTDIASIKTLNGQQDTRLAALEKTTGSHTTDIASMKNTDTQQNSRLSALEPEVAAEVKEVTLKTAASGRSGSTRSAWDWQRPERMPTMAWTCTLRATPAGGWGTLPCPVS